MSADLTNNAVASLLFALQNVQEIAPAQAESWRGLHILLSYKL